MMGKVRHCRQANDLLSLAAKLSKPTKTISVDAKLSPWMQVVVGGEWRSVGPMAGEQRIFIGLEISLEHRANA
jgi:hypothetical protein